MNDEFHDSVRDSVRAALAEDIGSGDLTAALVPEDQSVHARVVTREDAVLCGIAWFDEVYAQLDDAVSCRWSAADGDRIAPGEILCSVQGPARAVLTGERTALNFLQTLSGTATEARRHADAVAGSGMRVLDTRKTLPGLRLAQKYAVRCGGCHNHRLGLYDAILIKENHIRSTGSIAAAIGAAHTRSPGVPVEVEIESLAQLDQALGAGADIVMLDNFDLADMSEAVRRNRAHGGNTRLEASGNVSLQTIGDIAATGVDFVSVGGLTKHLRAIDLSMQFEPPG